MPKQEAPISSLQNYLPAGTYDAVVEYLQLYNVHLTVARERKSILGDYRHRTHHHNHRISVNGNLNKYAFLITLLHEMAHLLTFEQYGNKVQAHGGEWKMIYGKLLAKFISNHLFPVDIENELLRSLKNPAASSCAEDGLIRILRKYDAKNSTVQLIEELTEKALFIIENGRIFQRGEKIRKRYKCTEVKTGKVYLFSPVYEVEVVSSKQGVVNSE
jgi:SprT protein